MTAEQILALRKRLGMMQFEFALAIGVSQGHASFLESGKAKPRPRDLARMRAVAEAHGVALPQEAVAS